MFIVLNNKVDRPYIAGIFKKRKQWDKFFDAVPDKLGVDLITEEMGYQDYPFYVYEDKSGFQYFKKDFKI